MKIKECLLLVLFACISSTSFASGFSDCLELAKTVQGWTSADYITACRFADLGFKDCAEIVTEFTTNTKEDLFPVCRNQAEGFSDCYAISKTVPGRTVIEAVASCRQDRF